MPIYTPCRPAKLVRDYSISSFFVFVFVSVSFFFGLGRGKSQLERHPLFVSSSRFVRVVALAGALPVSPVSASRPEACDGGTVLLLSGFFLAVVSNEEVLSRQHECIVSGIFILDRAENIRSCTARVFSGWSQESVLCSSGYFVRLPKSVQLACLLSL